MQIAPQGMLHIAYCNVHFKTLLQHTRHNANCQIYNKQGRLGKGVVQVGFTSIDTTIAVQNYFCVVQL